jgi:hypothetical protein
MMLAALAVDGLLTTVIKGSCFTVNASNAPRTLLYGRESNGLPMLFLLHFAFLLPISPRRSQGRGEF